MMHPSIYAYVKAQESAYDTEEVRIADNWNWSMKDHVQMIFQLKNSQFTQGDNDFLRAYKNIMEPVLNLSYWSEDIELKDVVFYIESDRGRVLSFLIKKYHDEVYAKKYNLDRLFDDITEEDIDYGGVLVHKGKKPEVLPLPSIAFADQTDILGGPIGIKMNFSPEALRRMSSRGWGDPKNGATITLDELITLAEPERDPAGESGQKKNQTTGKNIEVYVVRGSLPEHYLKDNDNMENSIYQVQIVGFYTDKRGKKQGVTLYRKKGDDTNIKFHTSKSIYGRALGRGVGEGLLHPQIWTNFLEIHKMNMLEAASKVVLYTDDEGYTSRNTIQDMENLEVTTVADGKRIQQVPNAAPTNIQLFENSINQWFENAQTIGSAFDPLLGKEPVSGTTFRGQERTVAQGRGLHQRRLGQRAKFIEELYRDWIIPDMVREILDGTEFLAELTADEVEWMSNRLADNYAFTKQIEQLFEGEIPDDKEILREEFLGKFSKRGSKHVLKILKDEFRDVEVKMGVNIAGKQKDLAMMTDKLLSIFQFVFSNPQGFQQVMQIPGMSSAFNDILEFSGISNVDFANIASMQLNGQSPQPTSQVQQLQQQLAPQGNE